MMSGIASSARDSYLLHMQRLTLLLIAVLATGCSSSLDGPATRSPIAVTRLRSEPFSFTYYSGLPAERLVIRDQTAWVAAWASMWPAFAPIPAPPNVDFSRDMIVVAALGARPTGGYSIFVDSAGIGATGLMVWIGTTTPGAHCVTTQAFTQPLDIARLPRVDAAVRFVDVPKVVDCE